MVSDHGNHKSRHLDRVAYMAICGVAAFDNFDSLQYKRKLSSIPFL